jgi:YVTN family beta-propeller protein
VGSGPAAIAVNPNTNTVYVANYSGSSVSVINGSTNSVTGTVNIGSGPSAIAVNSVTNLIYVANQTAGNVSVISGTTEAVRITVGTQPLAITVNPITNEIFVANYGSNTMSVITASTNTVAATVTTGSHPYAVAVNQVTNQVYVANSWANTVTQVDGASPFGVTATLTVGGSGTGNTGLAISDSTNQIYVTNSGNKLYSVNASLSTVTNVSVGSGPIAVGINSTDNLVYVAAKSGNQITEVDGSLYFNTSLGPTSSGGIAPYASAIDQVRNLTYTTAFGTTYNIPFTAYPGYDATFFGNGAVYRINGNTGALTGPLSVNPYPLLIAVDPVKNLIYVASFYNSAFNPSSCTVVTTPDTCTGNDPTQPGTIAIIDGSTFTVSSTVNVGTQPNAMALNPVTGKLYVANCACNGNALSTAYTGTVTVIDTTATPVSKTITGLGSFPNAIAVNPKTNKIYSANFTGNGAASTGNVTVIDGSTDTVATTITVGSNPAGIAVNPNNNRIYVTDSNWCGYNSPDVKVIDGSSNSVVETLVPTWSGSQPSPWPVVVDPFTNKVYVGDDDDADQNHCNGTLPWNVAAPGTGTSISVVEWNGTSDSVAKVLTAPSGTTWWGLHWASVDTAANKVLFSNTISANISVVDTATDTVSMITIPERSDYSACASGSVPLCKNEGGQVLANPATGVYYSGETGCCFTGQYIDIFQPSTFSVVPMLTTISPVSDAYTISTSPVFQTTNTTPSFTFSTSSTYSTYAPYSSLSITNPAPTALYYSVDSLEGVWTPATVTSGAGANPGTFSATLASSLSVGPHMLYAYGTYGREGVPDSGGVGSGNSPEIGNMTALYFIIH